MSQLCKFKVIVGQGQRIHTPVRGETRFTRNKRTKENEHGGDETQHKGEWLRVRVREREGRSKSGEGGGLDRAQVTTVIGEGKQVLKMGQIKEALP